MAVVVVIVGCLGRQRWRHTWHARVLVPSCLHRLGCFWILHLPPISIIFTKRERYGSRPRLNRQGWQTNALMKLSRRRLDQRRAGFVIVVGDSLISWWWRWLMLLLRCFLLSFPIYTSKARQGGILLMKDSLVFLTLRLVFRTKWNECVE